MLAACGRFGFDVRADAAIDGAPPCTFGFVQAGTYPGGVLPGAISLADLDHDGALDAVIGSRSGVIVYPGQGDGTFATGAPFATPSQVASALETVDMDGDGFADVVLADNAVCVMHNTGGTLSPCQSYPTGSGPNSIAVGRLDSGTSIDVVVGNQINNTIGIYLNDGTGTLGSPVVHGMGGTNPVFEVLAEVSGDSFADFVAVNLLSDNVAVRFGGPSGQPVSQPVAYATGSHPTSVRAGDLDGDGDLDLVVASRGAIEVFINNGGGGFAASVPYDTTVVSTTEGRGLALGDFDRDGHLDAVCTDPDDGSVGLYLNHGDGTFAPVVAFPIGAAPRTLAVGDLDGDLRLDLVVSLQSSSLMGVLLGRCEP
jgi:hypothetical protein